MGYNERTKILQMVEEGKITVDEAVKLIEAIKPEPYDTNGVFYSTFDRVELEERFKKFSCAAESFAKDVAGKINETWKEMEPKVRNTSKTVIEKAAGIIDDLSKTLNESLQNLDKECCCNQEEQQDCCCNDTNNADCNKEECADSQDAPQSNGPAPTEDSQNQEN